MTAPANSGRTRPVQRALLAITLAAVSRLTLGLEVHLTELTIYDTHDVFTKPDIYFKCEGDTGIQLLPDVKDKDHKYSWQASGTLVTSLAPGGCKNCGFYEQDRLPLDEDDTLGEFQLCAHQFAESNGQAQLLEEGQFLAMFRCAGCVSPPPPPAWPSPPPPAPPPPMLVPLADVPSADLWRFVSTGWVHRGTAGAPDFTWAVLRASVYANDLCTGEPLGIDKVEYLKCCGEGAWAPVEADSDGMSSEDSGESASSETEADPDDDGGNTSLADDAWKDDPEDWSVPGPYTGKAEFTFKEYMACKDPNKGIMENVQITECQQRCATWPTCHAYTYNHVHNKCYLKESCFDVRTDDGHTDKSGIKHGNPGMELMGAHPGWVARHVHQLAEPSRDGGASVAFHLTKPQVVSCVSFDVPPGNLTAFPDAGRIEFSVDGGRVWQPVVQLDNINSHASAAVKQLSVRPLSHNGGDAAAASGSTESGDASSGRRSTSLIAAAAVAAFLALAGVAAGVLGLAAYNRRQAAAREDYERRFQAVFDSPDFEELDRIVEQDQHTFMQALNPANWRAPWGGRAYSQFS
eukprot:jgi/Tetstr1/435991/TSEL_024872.t1